MNRLLMLSIVLLLQIGCSGGSSSSLNDSGDIIDRSGVTVGSITGFSSVIVNGVTYDTSSAAITVNGISSQQSTLQVGQIVVIRGAVDPSGVTGDAESVATIPMVRGPLATIDIAQSTVTVLGTTVEVTRDTRLAMGISNLSELQPNDRVEVHGFRTVTGVIRASWLGRSTTNGELLQGLVDNLDSSNQQLRINSQLVDYSNATLAGFDNNIRTGDQIVVEGTLQGALLTASSVARDSATQFTEADEGLELTIEGVIDSFNNVGSFTVGGVLCQTNTDTELNGGALDQLGVNVKIEIQGVVNSSGVLVATELDFEIESDLTIETTVQSIDASAMQIRLLNTNFTTTIATQFADESDAKVRPFGLNDIQVGDFVKAKSFLSGSQATLSSLIRKEPEDKTKLNGRITDVNQPQLRVGTITIGTTASTEFEIDDTSVTADDFFAQLEAGNSIEAEGFEFVDGVPVALQLEISD